MGTGAVGGATLKRKKINVCRVFPRQFNFRCLFPCGVQYGTVQYGIVRYDKKISHKIKLYSYFFLENIILFSKCKMEKIKSSSVHFLK